MLLFTWKKAKKKEHPYVLPLFFAFSGLNYLFEYIVLILNKAYQYKPNIFKNNYQDNLFGAITSQLIVVPTAGLIVSLFQLKYKWFLLFSSVLFGVEKTFVKKNFFKHFWWSPYYTLIGLQAFFFISKVWKHQLVDKKNQIFTILTVYFSFLVPLSTLNFYYGTVCRAFLFKGHWFHNPIRSSIAISTIYTALCSLLFTLAIMVKRSYAKLCSIFLMMGVDLYLVRINRLEITRTYYIGSFVIKYITVLIGQKIYETLIREVKRKDKNNNL